MLEILEKLEIELDKNIKHFCNLYRSLPLHEYEEIEALSYSKTKKKENMLARKVSRAFHTEFKK